MERRVNEPEILLEARENTSDLMKLFSSTNCNFDSKTWSPPNPGDIQMTRAIILKWWLINHLKKHKRLNRSTEKPFQTCTNL